MHRSGPACHPKVMSTIHALAASAAHAKLEAFSYDPGPLGDEQVEIEVQYCGICHSDLSMLNNEWQMTQFPFVPGHEAIGTVSALGRNAKLVSLGQASNFAADHCRASASSAGLTATFAAWAATRRNGLRIKVKLSCIMAVVLLYRGTGRDDYSRSYGFRFSLG